MHQPKQIRLSLRSMLTRLRSVSLRHTRSTVVALSTLGALSLATTSCSQPGSTSTPSDADLSHVASPIYHGELDDSPEVYPGVVALFMVDTTGEFFSCSGTIIKTQGTTAWVLTAGHCVEDGAVPTQVVIGVDSYTSNLIFNVDRYKQDPLYNVDQNDDLTHDFAMVRFQGVPVGTQVIPAMSPAEDDLESDKDVTFVGYGVTDTDQDNSKRFRVSGVIDQVHALTFEYLQNPTVGGPCYGDSGGPAVSLVNGQMRVSGVTSYGYGTGPGNDDCENGVGISARTSSDYESFIVPFLADQIGDDIGDDACESCAASANAGCATETAACDANAACAALRTCLGLAEYTEDYGDCFDHHASGATDLHNLATCACKPTACATACSLVCIGTDVGGGNTAGTGGTAGSAGASGASGTAGSSGSAGNSGTAGTSGIAGSSGNAGAAGAAGDASTGGSVSGSSGATSDGGAAGASTSGTSGTSGSSAVAGTAGATAIAPASSGDGGCAISPSRTSNDPTPARGTAALGLIVALGAMARRRR